MTWFGPVSAWSAGVIGLMMLGLAALQYSWGIVTWAPALAATLLLIGCFRTLRGMSGGLRLLAGAWGVVMGLMGMPVAPADPSLSYSVTPDWALLMPIIALPWIAVAGLALTVLHKERK